MIENWKELNAEIEKLTLPELEVMIKDLYQAFEKSHNCRDRKLEACLTQRKYIINKDFKFTPEAVRQIDRINNILTEGTAKVLNRTRLLYRQMEQLKAQGDKFLDDFMVEGTVSVMFNSEESVLTLAEDENNGQSDYVAMAEVLCTTQNAYEHLRSFLFLGRDNDSCETSDEELSTDKTLERNWNIELLDAPALSGINYFCYASHCLFVDSKYSLSDCIRVNDIWNEVTVTHQNLVKNPEIT